jgi:hypothetical protein
VYASSSSSSCWGGCQAFLAPAVCREHQQHHAAISSKAKRQQQQQQQPRKSVRIEQHRATRQDQDEQQQRYSIRAGTEGYSVLRQPLSHSNWGSDQDPNFDNSIPLHLEDDGNDGDEYNVLDEDWWSNRSSSSKRGGLAEQRLSSSSPLFPRTMTKKNNKNDYKRAVADSSTDKDNEEIDLFQRTLETLDYPRILQALQEECTTAPARTIVRQALQSASSSLALEKQQQQQLRAYQPLVANTVQEAQERYRAVQEMEWLLLPERNNHNGQTGDNDDNDDDFFDRLQDATYRDRLGRKQRLIGAPPPTFGNSLDLDRLLSPLLVDNIGSVNDDDDDETIAAVTSTSTTRRPRSRRRRVLEGIEIAQIIDMMDIMENVRLWGNALRRVNEQQQQQHAEEQLLQDDEVDKRSSSNDDNSNNSKKKLEFIQLPQFAVDCIQINTTLHDLLHNAFEDADNDSNGNNQKQKSRPAASGRDDSSSFGKLSSRTFPVLGRLRARIRTLRQDITSTLDTLIAMPSIQAKLAMESGGPIVSEVANSGRLVLPIAAKYATSIGIVHDSSRSGKTVRCLSPCLLFTVPTQ